jgi:hypothetical protein
LVNTGWQLRPIDTKRSCGHLQGYICQGFCSHFLGHLALTPVLCFPNCRGPPGRNHLEVTPSSTSPSTRNLTFLLLEFGHQGSFHSLSFIHSFTHSASIPGMAAPSPSSEPHGGAVRMLTVLVQSVIRRSWFLCSKWKNPSRARGWGEVR